MILVKNFKKERGISHLANPCQMVTNFIPSKSRQAGEINHHLTFQLGDQRGPVRILNDRDRLKKYKK